MKKEEGIYTVVGPEHRTWWGLYRHNWWLQESTSADLMRAKMVHLEGKCDHQVVEIDIDRGQWVTDGSCRCTQSTAYYCWACKKFVIVTTDRRPSTAFKLCKQRRDGTLGPLFINRDRVIPIGEWLEAEDHPTKGYAHRPGWHCTFQPVAPHIAKEPKSGEKRVWCEVEVENWKSYDRPESQGGAWVLASRMKVLNILG